VLDRLASPDDVEARVRQRQLRFGLNHMRVELGVASECAAHRLAGDIERHHVGAGARERGRELPFATADVEHTRSPSEPFALAPSPPEQKSLAQARVRRDAQLGGPLPDSVVISARARHDSARLRHQSSRN